MIGVAIDPEGLVRPFNFGMLPVVHANSGEVHSTHIVLTGTLGTELVKSLALKGVSLADLASATAWGVGPASRGKESRGKLDDRRKEARGRLLERLNNFLKANGLAERKQVPCGMLDKKCPYLASNWPDIGGCSVNLHRLRLVTNWRWQRSKNL